MNRIVFFSGAALTAILAGFFVLSERESPKTSYAPLSDILLDEPKEPRQTRLSPIFGIPAAPPKIQQSMKKNNKRLPKEHQKTSRSQKPKAGRGSPAHGRAGSKTPDIVSPLPSKTAVQADIASAFKNREALPQYVTEGIIHTFENDLSKYPLKKSETRKGVTLRLIALENLGKMFVVKLAVDNRTNKDFFIKDFKAASRGRLLEELPLFGVLVEAEMSREGYLLLENPGQDARIKIDLNEDGGGKRAITIDMDCPL
jgi:hypothetical protein